MRWKYPIYVLFCGVIIGCNPTKYLSSGEKLYNQVQVEFADPDKINRKKTVKLDLENIIKPKPNTGLFKSRLLVYHWMGEPKKEHGVRSWIKKRLGEPPSLYRPQQVDLNTVRLKHYLRNHGYFDHTVSTDTVSKGKKIDITYRIETTGQYRINEVVLPADTNAIQTMIQERQRHTHLVAGEPYLESNLDQERTRLANRAADQGYFDFSRDYLYYFVDTLTGELRTDVHVRVQPLEDSTEHRKYYVGNTLIIPNYDLAYETDSLPSDTLNYTPAFRITQAKPILLPRVLDRLILQDKGELYERRFQNTSINHLLELGVFKFVNIQFDKRSDTLDRTFYLTPALNQDIAVDFELNNRTGSYFGTAASVSYTHKNLLRRALRFTTSFFGGVETQVGNNRSLINTLDLNFQAGLSIPRFLVPFKIKQHSGFYLPRTAISVVNNFQRRSELFTLNTSYLSFGYQWNENNKITHTFNPILLNRVQVINTTAQFDSTLEANARLLASFQNVFIGGLEYVYTYTNHLPNATFPFWFFKSEIKLAGNAFNAISNLANANRNSENKFVLIDLPYSQFVSLEFDVRRFFPRRKSMWAFRFAPSIGVAYGNSDVLPYTEQFFVGGANSIRSFRIRNLGPGTFSRASSGDVNAFIDQTGDVKLEMMMEYRFDLFSLLKGAAFLDAGNIWLLNDDQSIVEGKFKLNEFHREIALGGGLGVRLDLDYFVIRADMAIPLRRPIVGSGFEWNTNKWKFSDKEWRQDNLILNLAIGYPF